MCLSLRLLVKRRVCTSKTTSGSVYLFRLTSVLEIELSPSRVVVAGKRKGIFPYMFGCLEGVLILVIRLR